VTDLESIFLPVPADSLLVTVSEEKSREPLEALLTLLPSLYQDTTKESSCFGTAVEAASLVLVRFENNIQWCDWLMCLIDVFDWCVWLVCVRLMCLIDVFDWCVWLMCLIDVFDWCVLLMCFINVFDWCVWLMCLIDVWLMCLIGVFY